MQINNNTTYDAGVPGTNDNNVAPPGGGSISDMFTTLLVAQIQNQDPLAPMEASQFVTQFAQLSQVEAMQQMASLTSASAAMQESMLVVTLGSQVGSNVMVAADSVELSDQPVKGGFVLDSPTDDAALILTGPDGTEHRIELGPHEAGKVDFEIDPDALGLPPGNYSMRVDAASGETPRTELQGELTGVRLGTDGSVILTVSGVGDVGTGDITRFLGRPNSADTFFS
ncbi:flagellar hook capping FlgD N-terminal domain-containing protein [Dyella koreensis]|uniref:Basal-body rod modification protein FlgD n=1 Tax=Dyella koreensis TaxID=311235 RepID=A0ABW8K5F7_9GAMM